MSNPTTVSKERSAQSHALHGLVRELSAKVLEVDPTEIVDPRGLILDVTRHGEWAARVRTGAKQWAFGPAASDWRPGRPTTWEWLNPADDEALPGRSVLADASLLSEVTMLDAPRANVVRHRVGRRAVIRVVGLVGERRRIRYVKLLRKKTMRRAVERFGFLSDVAGDTLVTPIRVLPEYGLLVFDEVDGRSLHEALWTSTPDATSTLVASVADLCRRLSEIRVPDDQQTLPSRGFEDERASAINMLNAGSRARPGLAHLRQAVEAVALPQDHSSAPGFVHADLHDKQVFETEVGLKVIDCEGSARGPAIIDQTNLIEHVRLRSFQGAPFAQDTAELLRDVLGVQTDDPKVGLLSGLIRARLAGVYALRPWWWWLSEKLERDALRLLGAGEGSL